MNTDWYVINGRRVWFHMGGIRGVESEASAEKFLSAYVLNGKYRARTAMAWEVKSTPQHL